MASKLPPYMVPTYFTQLESFPHTPNGKVSVKALRELEINTGEIREFERPETKTENEVFVILAEQLGTYEFGTGDDLFTLGLTSLSMISLVTQLYKRFGVSVPVSALLCNRTVRDISSLMDTLTAERSENSAKAEQRVYYPMTPNQMGIYFDCMQHPEGIGYHLPNGEIMCMGRRDGQIKLRGLRIEIGEIEQSIFAYEGVTEAAVLVKKLNFTEHLVGYISADRRIDIDGLKEFLSARLTPYMVPTVIMQLDEMPYTPNGKLDRKRLPEPDIEREYVAPSDEAEEFFCGIFEESLGIEKVGTADNFFDIGGTSLLAIQLTILASNGGYTVKFRDIFENPTPAKLAAFVGGSTEHNSESRVILDYDYSQIKLFSTAMTSLIFFGLTVALFGTLLRHA